MTFNFNQPLVHLQADMVIYEMHCRRKVCNTIARAGVQSDSGKIDSTLVNELYHEFSRKFGV